MADCERTWSTLTAKTTNIIVHVHLNIFNSISSTTTLTVALRTSIPTLVDIIEW